ncbi:MAG: hypothetical protein CMN74_12300 [Sphingorhabdus sp.]|nr:hypothetical protein [Sphingorhabdus sp.]|tara:strand:- start:1875 stop:3788 length:1914 start_codon:yes stop_codon:yes gene_type:complete
MAKAVKTIGIIAGAAALIGTAVLTAGGTAFAATALGGALGGTGGIVAVAGLVSGVAAIASRALSKPPPARGSVTETVIDVDPPSPYAMGEGYFAGVLRHRVGYGPTLKKVPNPYLLEIMVYSVAGPIAAAMVPQFEFAPVGSYYNDFFAYDAQLGQSPEPDALVPPYGAAPGWTAQHKLSGMAAMARNYKFDKDGKRYASGLPQGGAVAKWVRAYDPRKDSTFPGGSGSHRLGDETTYEWTETPALHAGMYAYGRYQNGKRVMGMGLPARAIDWQAVASWANDCEANDWTMFGVVFEPGDRWGNLRDICIAGGGEPLPLTSGLSFHWDRPRVVLDTITEADVFGDIEATGMQSYRDRINTVIPQVLIPEQNWSLLPCDPIVGQTYRDEDGEPRTETWPFNFVKKTKQGGQLATYKMANSRELWPITVPVGPRLRHYRPGDCLALDLPQAGLDTDAVILRRDIDPATMVTTLTLMGETAAKHAYALGETAVLPPTPYLGQTAEDRDAVAASVAAPDTAARVIVSKSVAFPVTTDQTSATIAAFSATLDNGQQIDFPAGSITGLTESTSYVILWSITGQSYSAALMPALAELAAPDNVIIRYAVTQAADGTYPPAQTPPGGDGGGGYGGGSYQENTVQP